MGRSPRQLGIEIAQARRARFRTTIMSADSAVQQSDGMRSAAGSPAPGLAPRGRGGAMVRIADIKKTFGELEAIRQLSFDVADGEFLSVLGPSGCGKSTLLMMIAGLIGPSAGEIHI